MFGKSLLLVHKLTLWCKKKYQSEVTNTVDFCSKTIENSKIFFVCGDIYILSRNVIQLLPFSLLIFFIYRFFGHPLWIFFCRRRWVAYVDIFLTLKILYHTPKFPIAQVGKPCSYIKVPMYIDSLKSGG